MSLHGVVSSRESHGEVDILETIYLEMSVPLHENELAW